MSSEAPSASARYLKEKYGILLTTCYRPGQILSRYTPARRQYSEEMAQAINQEWLERKRTHPWIFDGPLYDLWHYEEQRGLLHLDLGDMSYKEYVGTRTNEFRTRFGESHCVNPPSASMIVVTSDDKYVLGMRGGSVDSHQGMYGTITGFMERGTDVTNATPDPLVTVRRELQEESGVRHGEIESLLCLGATRINQTSLVFRVNIHVTSTELEKRAPSEVEFTSFRFVPSSGDHLRAFIFDECPRIAPYCLADLVLLGFHEFGDEWVRSLP